VRNETEETEPQGLQFLETTHKHTTRRHQNRHEEHVRFSVIEAYARRGTNWQEEKHHRRWGPMKTPKTDALPKNPWMVNPETKEKLVPQEWPKVRGGERQ
jgi:hypothetical protein